MTALPYVGIHHSEMEPLVGTWRLRQLGDKARLGSCIRKPCYDIQADSNQGRRRERGRA